MERKDHPRTSGESYFFRDMDQFALLRNRILPELVEGRAKQRTLRIWSAGCSTGEEPYSIAILLNEMLPRRESWDIFILGTDTNEEAIEKAKRGIYTKWSFRTVNPEIQKCYFRKRRNGWELEERIRNMVLFRTGDLVRDVFPSVASGIHDIDLICCRNVFIYFSNEAVSIVINKFSDTLKDGGYLITGHGELHGQSLGRLRAKIFAESIIYKKASTAELPEKPAGPATDLISTPRGGHSPLKKMPDSLSSEKDVCKSGGTSARASSEKKTLQKEPVSDAKKPSIRDLRSQMEQFMLNGAYAEVVKKAECIIKDAPDSFDAHYFMARAHANSGDYAEASQSCRRAIAIDPTAVNPYFLLAQIAEARRDTDEAKNALKKAIYLAPMFVAAYVELGAIYDKENDSARAKKTRTTAMRILETLPPDALVEPYEGITAGELLQWMKKMIQ